VFAPIAHSRLKICSLFTLFTNHVADSIRNDESALAAPILAIATVNVWNRINATARQVAGEAW